MDFWQHVSNALAAEFGDLPDAHMALRTLLRLLVALLLGGLLGWERERHGKDAGLRTHMLVCLGAAVFVLVPQLAGASMDAQSRVVQGVITGIGFLGAGSIIKNSQNENHVHGMTTAAGIWLTAAIGVCVGMGRETSALLVTLLALAVFALLKPLDRRIDAGRKRRRTDRDDA